MTEALPARVVHQRLPRGQIRAHRVSASIGRLAGWLGCWFSRLVIGQLSEGKHRERCDSYSTFYEKGVRWPRITSALRL